MESPINHQDQAVYRKGKIFPKDKAKGELHQMKFLGANSNAGMVGGGSGAAEWNGSFGVQSSA